MIFVLDNYDSFTYNLVQYIGELGAEVCVYRNDQTTVSDIEALRPERIVISPGPCTPQEAGISIDVIRHFAGRVPILGVCLGHQAIGEAFGGKVIRARNLMHGKTSSVEHDGKSIFSGIPSPMIATRYHSLIVEEKSFPPTWRFRQPAGTAMVPASLWGCGIASSRWKACSFIRRSCLRNREGRSCAISQASFSFSLSEIAAGFVSPRHQSSRPQYSGGRTQPCVTSV